MLPLRIHPIPEGHLPILPTTRQLPPEAARPNAVTSTPRALPTTPRAIEDEISQAIAAG